MRKRARKRRKCNARDIREMRVAIVGHQLCQDPVETSARMETASMAVRKAAAVTVVQPVANGWGSCWFEERAVLAP